MWITLKYISYNSQGFVKEVFVILEERLKQLGEFGSAEECDVLTNTLTENIRDEKYMLRVNLD